MKEHGYQHVSDIPKGSFAAGDPVAQPSATASEPSSQPLVTHIVVPSATPEPSSTRSFGPIFLTVVIGTYCLPLLVAFSRRHRQTVPLAILDVAFGWIVCLAWAFARGKE
jgi:hypothetical protein